MESKIEIPFGPLVLILKMQSWIELIWEIVLNTHLSR